MLEVNLKESFMEILDWWTKIMTCLERWIFSFFIFKFRWWKLIEGILYSFGVRVIWRMRSINGTGCSVILLTFSMMRPRLGCVHFSFAMTVIFTYFWIHQKLILITFTWLQWFNFCSNCLTRFRACQALTIRFK